MIGVLVLLLLPAAAFAGLAVAPKGLPFVAGSSVVVAVSGYFAARTPLPSSGPDDWFHGLPTFSAQGCVLAALYVAPFQFWRWWRDVDRRSYGLAVVLAGALAMLVTLFKA